MSTKTYRVTVKHDNGYAVILVYARSILAAREIVKKAEGCPDSAICSILKLI